MALSGRQYEEYRHEQAQHRANQRESLREQIGRDPSLVRDARSHMSEIEIPGTPELRHARVLKLAGLPDWCGTRQVKRISIERGDPANGAARSDDHISGFEIELPFAEIDHETVWEDVCEECGCDRAIYTYSATHFIAGSERVYCPECQTTYYEEEWS